MEWCKEWPKEAGLWWFHGWRFKPQTNLSEKPELCLVEVRGTSQKGVMAYITHGHFLYSEEGAKGLWQKVDVPVLPKLESYDSKEEEK